MKVFLLRFGELFLKGDNKKFFENALEKDIKKKIEDIPHEFKKTQGRYIISSFDESDAAELRKRISRVFGLSSFSEAEEMDSNEDVIRDYVSKIDLKEKSFKVDVKRADKSFPISSMDFAKDLGGVLLDSNPNARVDLYEPEVTVFVDIRVNKKTYIFSNMIKGQGGLPLGTSGKALLLLSGGIDSPVAGYMMAKRGLMLDALHFYSYPYTSEKAKEKVFRLAKKLTAYTGHIKVHAVSFTKVQEAIHMNCAPEFMITIMRRIMMRVAEKICERDGLGAVVTGESLGQVASQTMQSMTVTGDVLNHLQVFRPCIGLDKEEIVKIAKDIDTFDISIEPYEDCCTVFLPKNPVIKPALWKAEKEEGFLNIEELVRIALESEEQILI